MSHTQKLSALTDELIHSILKFDPETNKRAYKHARDIAARGLRAHQYNRTNPFDIEKSYAGLDEKFRVLNRDDLADALDERVKEIQTVRNKWIPEYLHLLLLLADRPQENRGVEALELLRPKTPEQPITWQEILDEDPYSDEDIWKDIDYAAESSEDEDLVGSKRDNKKRAESPPTTVAEEEETFNPEDTVVPVDSGVLKDIEEAQFWKAKADEETGKVDIEERQVIRETLFMLAGLPTSLYVIEKHGNIRVNSIYVVTHAIAKTMEHLLSQLAATGRDIRRLRQWTARSSSLPLVQTFEAAVRRRLVQYDKDVAEIQRWYLVPEQPIAVSLLEVHAEIRQLSKPLLRLSQMVMDIEPELLVNPFVHLESLFQQTILAQMTLDATLFPFFSTLFFECLQTYLKPIRKWMQYGDLGTNDETFFVFEDDSGSETSSLWHDRFVLRRGKGNTLRAPEFLEPAAMRIFNTGKSVVFLKELGLYDTLQDAAGRHEPSPLNHQSVCGTSSELPLSPFPELFHAAFNTWISSTYSLASSVLRTYLFNNCGLLHILSNFHTIYLGADGSVFQDFANALFERMDARRRGWNDRFLLTELARGTYTTALGKADAGKIIVRTVKTKSDGRSVIGLASISMDYALPWPVQNIVQRTTLPLYHQIFTFLIQTYRAKYLLQSVRITPSSSPKAIILRARLLHFINTLRSYLTETVIARSYAAMVSAMTAAQDIDEMSTVHVKFLARMQEQAFLSDNLRTIHKSIISILDVCVLWADTCAKLSSDSVARKQQPTSGTEKQANTLKPKSKPKPSLKRRKSVIPAIIEAPDISDSDSDAGDAESPLKQSPTSAHPTGSNNVAADLHRVDAELKRLLPFITAGLRNIGRAGAQEVWEMLAERLEGGNPTAAGR